MSVQLTINTCGDCPYVSHSGAFTPGGAKPTCAHKMAAQSFTANKLSVDQNSQDKYHWRHRIVDRDAPPPAECPIRPAAAKVGA